MDADTKPLKPKPTRYVTNADAPTLCHFVLTPALRGCVPVRRDSPVILTRPSRRTYRVWTKDEEHALYDGVDKYGVGFWADILADPEFQILRCDA